MSAQLGFGWLEEARQERRMGTQGLLADTPRSRRNDPETSHQAAEKIRRSGVLAGHQTAILEAVRRWPGLSSLELASRLNLDRYQVARRLKELEPVYLARGAAKEINGRNHLTWWPK